MRDVENARDKDVYFARATRVGSCRAEFIENDLVRLADLPRWSQVESTIGTDEDGFELLSRVS